MIILNKPDFLLARKNMKKFMCLTSLFLALTTNVGAEIYHGIDIDAVYKNSDWNSKEDIIELIDNYTLLLHYQEEMDNCPIELPYVLLCYDKIAEKILNTLYVQPQYNMEDYRNLKNALSKAYGLKNCRNKYAWPTGSICEIESDSELADFLKWYIHNLIKSSKEKMFFHSPLLENYK